MLKNTILATTTLVLGLGLGYLSADGMPDVRTETKEVPVVKTVTKEVPKRVEIEVPVVKWRTKTRRVETYSTPSACLAAINAAEDIQRQSGVFAKTAAQYPPLVAKAYKAGLRMDGQEAKDIAARMQGLTGKIEGLSIAEAHEVFTVAAASCRAE